MYAYSRKPPKAKNRAELIDTRRIMIFCAFHLPQTERQTLYALVGDLQKKWSTNVQSLPELLTMIER